jgi:hypothetical protein
MGRGFCEPALPMLLLLLFFTSLEIFSKTFEESKEGNKQEVFIRPPGCSIVGELCPDI